MSKEVMEDLFDEIRKCYE